MRFARLLCLGIVCVSTIAIAQSVPVPLVNDPLVPTSIAPGGPSFTLDVNGTGFVSGSVVTWNGTALTTNFGDQSLLTATVPASNIAVPATAAVTVVNPGGLISNISYFEVRQPFSAASFSTSYFSLPDVLAEAYIAADLNNDGKLDLLVAKFSFLDSSVVVLLGHGDGTFEPAVNYPVQPQFALYMVTADFNNDGKLDVAVLGTDPDGTISTLLGNGDGSFQPYLLDTFTTSQCICRALAAGDFNADGKQDLVVLDDYTILSLLGNGDGTFASPITSPGEIKYKMVTGDFNGDGKLDLAMVGGLLNIGNGVYLGNGDGTFLFGQLFSTEPLSTDVLAADLNGDRKLDIVSSGYDAYPPYSAGFVVSFGNGDGSFQPGSNYSTSKGSGLLSSGDLNGDGKLDLLHLADNNAVDTFLGNGDGTFQFPGYVALILGFSRVAAIPGDFNGDGRLDFVISRSYVYSNETFIFVMLQSTSVVSPELVHFDPVKVGSTATASVRLSNIGNKPFTIRGIRVTGNDAAHFRESNNCGSSVPAGGSCTIRITFKPPTAGMFDATIKIADSAVQGLQTILVGGIGTN